jgi:hypothetical protein
MAKMLQNLSLEDETLDTINEGDEGPPSPSEAQMARRRVIVTEAARELAKTNVGYLVGDQPASSSSPMINTPHTIIPPPNTFNTLLNLQPKTANKALLLAALRESRAQAESLQQRVVELQASNILNETYCNKLRFQLAVKEEKQKGKGKGKGRLMGDGLPKMLTSDEFYEKVAEFSEWKQQEEAHKQAQMESRGQWQAALKEWEANEVTRKEENEDIRERNKHSLKVWQDSKKAATRAKLRFSQPKPTPEKLIPQPPKPRLKDFKAVEDTEGSDLGAGDDLEGDEGGSGESGSEDNQNDDGDESD